MPKIDRVIGREILDSRGVPTVEAIAIAGKSVGVAKVPSGISTGKYEAHELRDGDSKRYRGLGVLKAVENINGEINDALRGENTANQNKVDRFLLELDGTANKERLGGNSILAVSLAVARCEAAMQGQHLYSYLQQLLPGRKLAMPVPQMNLINGGKHASNRLSIQEYHILPIGTKNFSEALRMGAEIYQALRELLIKEGFQVEVAREGGFAPDLESSELAFTFLVRAIEEAQYVPGVDAFLGIDAAASEFYDDETSLYSLDGNKLSAIDLAYQYKTWRERYPLISFEDPFAEDEWAHWEQFMKLNGAVAQIVGDDLYATNPTRIAEGIRKGAANAALIKPNQVGTLTETLQAIDVAQKSKNNVVISHRSGETEDTFIADLCVAVGAGQIKTGAPSRSDRTSKYNRLLAIEDITSAHLSHGLQRFLEQMQSHYAVSGGLEINSRKS